MSHDAQHEQGSKTLKRVLLSVIIVSFLVLLVGGIFVYKNEAPIPNMVGTNDQIVTTHNNLINGQETYQQTDLADYGSLLGNGTFFGQDFTSETLNIVADSMRNFDAKQQYGKSYAQLSKEQQAAIADAVKSEIRVNRYNASDNTLKLTASQVYALDQVRAHYEQLFTKGDPARALPKSIFKAASSTSTIKNLSDFFYWTSWMSSTDRPGSNYSYTNNWPYYPAVGNVESFYAIFWSGMSAAFLVLMLAIIIWVYNHFKFQMESNYKSFPTINVNDIKITPSQRKTGKYFVIVCLVFLFQTLMGGLMAHYYVEGSAFYGLPILKWLPYNIAKTWHLQSAVFWIATAWLGMGLFIAPLVNGKEPKRQGFLVDVLFAALIVVVAGSYTGEWLGAKGLLGKAWFYFGNEGWNYLELGRFWEILLIVGLLLWMYIVWRALRVPLRNEADKGGLVHLLFYSAWTIPGFFAFSFLVNPSWNITTSDYWRWWVVHLWVEGVFEVFAVVVIGFMLVAMGLVTKKSTVRALYFQIIILMGSGIIGTGHHYYWIGDPDIWIALGACFSALEIVPLTLLASEAYDQYKMLRDGGKDFPYKAPFWFLISTAVWNLLGAGVLGFLINLPGVSFYEHGSFLTAAHGHGSMMGVYGMLAIALVLFSMRQIVQSDKYWSEKWFKMSVWGLNIGLVGMIVVTLFPIGVEQIRYTVEHGFWAARKLAFYREPLIFALLWLRIIPDSIFIVFGVLPLTWGVIKAFLHMKPSQKDVLEAPKVSSSVKSGVSSVNVKGN
ncbi:nitric-oxide reductase large subunit [Fodinisporobacter ferrooxydans]|uniref:Nitric-oxide reductase large subunit n=1 Tax=Fodinisporobacter ferrooxydans TaxID=2901836 RepID=A0ABY4CQ19_9BACL|nr:nitric-oxide reductase large subunit [Alicyclobacillaceae bacterium MYW30-H2]